jgi:predicted ribosome quality control (RQC) complex YloA/Tae2 family protein
MTRLELCEALATDYAKRASSLSLKFEEAYQKYFKRCEIRSYENLLQQFTVGNLGNLEKKVKKVDTRNDIEYIITQSDDDCEDGVCKL